MVELLCCVACEASWVQQCLWRMVLQVTGVLENRFGFNKFWSSTVVMGSIIGVSVFVVGGLFLSRLVF